MSQPIKVKIMNEKEPIKIKATSYFPPVNVGGETDHSKLKNLDYEHSGHIGFASSEDIPTEVSQLENDKGYIDNNVSNLVNYELKGKTGTNLGVSIDNTTYVMTIELKNTAGEVISTGSVDLPLESMVIGASYDDSTKEIVLTLQSGEEVKFSVADLVSGLVSQSTFDTKMNEISQEFNHKFDMPYYYEYNGDTDFEDTSETTLAMFNEIKELMEAGQKPCIIVKKGATGANSYITYHFIVPQFGSLDTTYIMLKGSPVRKDGNTFNLVALNCEKDTETNQIKRVYEKKADGSIQISGGDKIYYYKMTAEYDKHDTTEATLAMFNEIAEKWRNGEKPLLLVQGYSPFEQYSWYAISAPLHGSWASNYLVFKFPSVYATQQGGHDYWGDLEISCTANNTTDGIITAVDISQKRQFYTTRYGVTSSRNTNQVLTVDNNDLFTPTKDYHPATKKYVDDTVASAGGGDGVFKVTLTANQTAGYDANKTIDEIQAAISANKTVIAVVGSDEYPLKYHTETELRFTSIELNRSVLVLYSDGVWTMQDTNMLKTSGGYVNGNINMNSNAITNIQKLHVDGEAPVYIGSTIETGVTNASRITGIAGGGVAIVRANTQGTYDPLFVANPTNVNHAATKGYVDNKLTSIQGYDATKTQTLKNINGVLTWQTDGE